MTRDPIASLLESATAKAATRRAETYEMVNARPGAKVAAMIELLASLRSVPVSTMLTDALSERLALHAASDRAYAPAILDAAEQYMAEHGAPSEESALGQLADQGLLHIQADNPLTRGLKARLFPSSDQNDQTEKP